jgi:hypothetical protein
MALCNHTGGNAQVCNAIGPCRVFQGGWGACVPRCPCPRVDAPLFPSCQILHDEASLACLEEPHCSFGGDAALGEPCTTEGCQPGLSCAVGLASGGSTIVSNACARPCSVDGGGCDEDAGETCQSATDCNGTGFCR